MNKIIFIIAILNLLLNTSCFSSRATHEIYLDEPDWFAHPKIKSGFIQAKGLSTKVGTDEGKCQVITSAFNKIYAKSGGVISHDEEDYKVSSGTFGNVSFYSKHKFKVEFINSDLDFSEFFESTDTLSYVKDNKSLIFVDYVKETANSWEEEFQNKKKDLLDKM